MITILLDDLPVSVQRQLECLSPGETASIVRGESQVAEVKITAPVKALLRPIGLCAGQFTVPDSFFEPLPDELQRAFEGRG